MTNRKKSSKLLLIFAVGILSALLAFSVSAKGGTMSGDGSRDNPYLIDDAADLIAFRDEVNVQTADAASTLCAKLTADIDISDAAWTPIGNSGYATQGYAGVFDGDGHKISGLKISSSASNQGLFGYLGLDGSGTNRALIKNLAVSGTVTSSGNYIGGIAGQMTSAEIVNCSFSGSVSSSRKKDSNVGGIIGYINNTDNTGKNPKPRALISGCANSADVSTDAKGVAGGIVGYAKFIDIENCYNTGDIYGTSRSGGIAGQMQNKVNASNCYNIGAVSGTSTSADIADFIYKGSELINCHYLVKAFGTGVGTADADCAKIESAEGLSELLGEAFVPDKDGVNGGYPILAWQAGSAGEVKNPRLELMGNTVLKVLDGFNTADFSVKFADTEPSHINWSVVSGENVISVVYPVNPDEYNTSVVIKAINPGKAVIQAATDDESLKVSAYITVLPEITGREIEGIVAAGNTVSAKITVLGAKPYDYDNYPELVFRWKYLTSEDYLSGNTGFNSYKSISGANDRTFTIPESLVGDYLSYTVMLGSESFMPSSPYLVKSSDEYNVEADADALVFDFDTIKTDMQLELALKGANGSTIEWTSDNRDVINSETGAVVLPKTGKVTVTLTAVLKSGEAVKTKTFTFEVYSLKQTQIEIANMKKRLKNGIKSLGNFYKLYPVYGTDTNVLEMLCDDIKNSKEPEMTAAIESIEEVYGGAGIAENGDITYFYADPNNAPNVHNGSFRVTFVFSLGGETQSLEVPVIIPWNAELVKQAMTEQILPEIALPSYTEQNISLPVCADGKLWALASWTTSDETAVSINTVKKSANERFSPDTGIIYPGLEEKHVKLTAAVTFGFTNASINEPEIVLYKTFDVTVGKIDEDTAEKIKTDLEKKLENGLEKAGLRDAATGKALEINDGVYTAVNDILYPTTRDFKIDGKYYPVTIKSDNEDVIVSPDANNAARTTVYRPMPGEEPAKANVTLTILDKSSGVSVSKTFAVEVKPLTDEEIESERKLLKKVSESVFDGIKARNKETGDIRYDLSAFTEVYENNGKLVFVYSNDKMTGSGIVPTALEGWEELEAWRLFRSSNPASISHENLKVTINDKAKDVTLTTALSSETLGKYGELYKKNPVKYKKYESVADLYYNLVTLNLTVRGKSTPAGAKPLGESEKITVTFTLLGADKNELIKKTTLANLDETVTAFDVFKTVLKAENFTYEGSGSYVSAITDADGNRLGEFDYGKYSGWMYKVNGKIPDYVMTACGLKNGDDVVMFYTKDYNELFTNSGSGSSGMGSDNDTKKDNEKSDGKTDEKPADGNTEKDNETNPGGEKAEIKYSDVTGHWANDEIAKVSGSGLMKGVSETEFSPDTTLTRAMFATILYRFAYDGNSDVNTEKQVFSDVAGDAWYAAAVVWCADGKIILGVAENTFAPDNFITREQMALILYRYALSLGETEKMDTENRKPAFSDTDTLSDESKAAIKWASENGLVTGLPDGRFAPKDNVTRAQCAAVFARALGCKVLGK